MSFTNKAELVELLNDILSSRALGIISLVVAVIMATTMIFVRSKANKTPLTYRKICLPPIFMGSGALMFLIPTFRLTFMECLESIVLGVIFSLFIIKTTHFTVKDKEIYLKPSKYFIIVLIILFVFRFILKLVIGSQMMYGETAGMFFLLAFVMISCWRIGMLIKFNSIKKSLQSVAKRAD